MTITGDVTCSVTVTVHRISSGHLTIQPVPVTACPFRAGVIFILPLAPIHNPENAVFCEQHFIGAALEELDSSDRILLRYIRLVCDVGGLRGHVLPQEEPARPWRLPCDTEDGNQTHRYETGSRLSLGSRLISV